ATESVWIEFSAPCQRFTGCCQAPVRRPCDCGAALILVLPEKVTATRYRRRKWIDCHRIFLIGCGLPGLKGWEIDEGPIVCRGIGVGCGGGRRVFSLLAVTVLHDEAAVTRLRHRSLRGAHRLLPRDATGRGIRGIFGMPHR